MESVNQWNELKPVLKLKRAVSYTLVSALILTSAFGLNQLLFEETNVTFIILFITSAGILLSINERVRNLSGTYEVGNYFILVFCLAVGSMADFQLLISNGGTYVLYTTYCMIVAILIHTIGCRLFKIDLDTAIITSVAGIYGPAFISPVATSLKNRSIISSGLAIGILGYAVATIWELDCTTC